MNPQKEESEVGMVVHSSVQGHPCLNGDFEDGLPSCLNKQERFGKKQKPVVSGGCIYNVASLYHTVLISTLTTVTKPLSSWFTRQALSAKPGEASGMETTECKELTSDLQDVSSCRIHTPKK
jgi:hypothetical protein